MRKILGGLLMTALLGLPAMAETPPKLERMTVTAGGEGMHYFPFYVARGGGFFAREGIDVDWVNVNSGTRQAASSWAAAPT